MAARLCFGVIKKSFEKDGYQLLTENYINNSQKLDYICPNNHKHSISWRDWNSKGARCPYCNGRPIITIDTVRTSMESEGYTLLTKGYINNKQQLLCKCPNGHVYRTNWVKWYSHGYRCSQCYGNAKKTIEAIRFDVESNGYKLVTSKYINCNQKLHLVCPNNHDYYVTWDNWKHSGSRCIRCGESGVSVQESVLVDFIKSVYSGDVILNSYDIIAPKELDIVIPDKKLALEYCGLYWHSELAGKDKNYHLNKLNLCNKAGYKLITIFEDEWIHKKDVVEANLKNTLGLFETKINAEECVAKEINITEARAFCNKFYIGGYKKSTVKLGLFYRGDLVSVMLFNKMSASQNNIWRLSVFCSRANYLVVDGYFKLLNCFENNYECDKIFSYADKRWFTEDEYVGMGFVVDKYIKPTCWYFKGSNLDRIDRRHVDKNLNVSKDNYNKIWDCGQVKYIKDIRL